MRLNSKFLDALLQSINFYCPGLKDTELRLFGSRIYDNKKGGDIDLLICTKHEELKRELKDKKHKILARTFIEVEEEKVDLLICLQQETEKDPFLSVIYPQSRLLYSW